MEKKTGNSKKPAAKKPMTRKALKAVKGGATSDFLLKLDGIKGESQDTKYPSNIE